MDNLEQPINLCCHYKYANNYTAMSGCVNPNAFGQCPRYNNGPNSTRMEQTTYDKCVNELPYDASYQWNGNLCNAMETNK